jgi:hypothetical protein
LIAKIDNEALQAIETADWDDIYSRAIKYALSKLSFRTGTPREGVPKREEAEEFVNEAIKKVIEGCTEAEEGAGAKKGLRKWDPSRGALLDYLISVIKSDISHLYKSEEYISTSRMPRVEGSTDDEPIEVEELLKRACIPEKHAEGINPDPPQTPEEIYTVIEVRNGLLKAVEGKGELEDIALCVLDGAEKPGDIAEQLGVETRVVNNAKKRLKRIYDGILPRRK